MAELIYTPTPTGIPKFLRHIQSAGVPEKFTTRYLEGVGFKSKSDRALIGVLKALDFIDASQVPTKRWNDYRDRSQSKSVLGQAIRKAYPDLFATYPDAHRKDSEAIRNFLSARTKAGDSTLRAAVGTFKALAAEASFDDEVHAGEPEQTPAVSSRRAVSLPTPEAKPGRGGPSININIELHLPETDNAEVYENLFAAMRKHLFE